jgi:hypothetical protein
MVCVVYPPIIVPSTTPEVKWQSGSSITVIESHLNQHSSFAQERGQEMSRRRE